MKHANLLPLPNMLPLINPNLTRTHIRHTNNHNTDQSYLQIIRLNKNQSSHGDSGYVSL